MYKVLATVFGVVGLVVLAAVGYGLVYLPGQMAAAAEKVIADTQKVLAREAPDLTLRHGEITGNPFNATVTVADVSLDHRNGDSVKAASLDFTVDPFSGEISAIAARGFFSEKNDTQVRLTSVGLKGLTPETFQLLELAGRDELTTLALIKRLEIGALDIDGISIVNQKEGEMTLRRISIDDMARGIVGRFALEGFAMTSKVPQKRGTFALARMEAMGLNIGELAVAVSNLRRMPEFTAPVIRTMGFEGFDVVTDTFRFSMVKARGDANYVSNGKGGEYANRWSFVMEGLSFKPGSKSRQAKAFFDAVGLDALTAEMGSTGTADHAKRTMSLKEMSVRLDGLAQFDLTAEVGNMPAGMYVVSVKPDEMQGLMFQVLAATLGNLTLVIKNQKLVQFLINEAARKQGIAPRDLIRAGMAQARQIARQTRDPAVIAIVDEIEKFLNDPKSLRVTVAPNPPLTFGAMAAFSRNRDPGAAIRALNLKVEANK